MHVVQRRNRTHGVKIRGARLPAEMHKCKHCGENRVTSPAGFYLKDNSLRAHQSPISAYLCLAVLILGIYPKEILVHKFSKIYLEDYSLQYP